MAGFTRELHLCEHVALQVDAGGELGQGHPPLAQLEDGAFGHVQDPLASPGRFGAAEGDLLHRRDELLEFAFPDDLEPAVAGCDLEAPGGERTAVDDGLRRLGDVDEAAWPHVTAAEAAHVDVAVLVGLRQAQEGDVEPSAVVPVEHGRLLEVCLGVARRAEEQVGPRFTAHRAGLGREGHHLVDPLVGGQPAHGVGIADAEVDDRTGDELHGRTPDHHGARTQRRRLGRRQGDPQIPRQRRVEATGRLGMELGRGGDHHVIDQRGGDPHMLGVQGAGLGGVLHLGDDDAAAVLGRLGYRELAQDDRLFVQSDVAQLVGGGAPDHRHVDGERGVQEVLPSLDLDHLHIIGGRRLVHPAAPEARVDESADADVGDDAWAVGGDLPVELGPDSLASVFHRDWRHAGRETA